MKRLLTLALILTLATALAAAAQPAPRGGGCCDRPCCGPMGERQGMRMGGHHGNPGVRGILAHADQINLTDEQRDKLESLMTEFRLAQVDRRAALEKAQIELKALERDEADLNAVNAAIDKVSKLKADMQKARYAHRHQVMSVLTDEQKDQLKKLRKDRKCDGKGKPGKMGLAPGFGDPNG
ncbi:MAG: Spy/CpxP family protein refolding chaperone [Candidatus Zixiibacteriota bacterium]|nr:MAG: Spy/CpxP family protein refolding chaperone [candidate division Zixibacteria bacterium]